MTLLVGQGNEHFWWLFRHELVRAHSVALDGCIPTKVEVVVMETNARAPVSTEPFLVVGSTIPGSITESNNVARCSLVADRDIQVTVRCDGQVTGGAEVIRYHHRTESVWQCDATVIRVTSGKVCLGVHRKSSDDQNAAAN